MRFLKKILTDAEITFVQKAVNPDEVLWSFWACKETACKVIQRVSPDTAFIPRRWQVIVKTITPRYTEGEVAVWGRDGIMFRLFPGRDYVHCVGSDDPASLDDLKTAVRILPDAEKNFPSMFLRTCFKEDLTGYFSCEQDDIEIAREKDGKALRPPDIYIRGKKTGMAFSMSHDGRFVAYAFHEPPHIRRPCNSPAKKACVVKVF